VSDDSSVARPASVRTSPALHAADGHDLIRVHGARVNNLKDVSVEIPKRRLTVFTGVSGSGKSSLVFDTIAAESQRLINETYSAFVQGFMPTLARPEVDVLILSMHDDERYLFEALKAGASGYVLKTQAFDRLSPATR
jgi:hypothetical protein